ncbi:MAG TPA: MFS transporter [Anaerolineaceae bacterium]|nr:MFS transporter [Anaerolineaceae bacterium]HPN53139.1 MFS transporter [Anaerolineaceae bacterium]
MESSEEHPHQATQSSRRLSLLSNPAFGVLWFSEAISLIGDRILMIALINMVYDWSGSAGAVSILPVIKAVPALALGTVAGVFVDRWPRKWIMVVSNLLLFGLVLAIPATQNLLLIYMIYFVMSVVSQFFIPARSAAIPALVDGKSLSTANALFAAAFVGAIAIGPALGGWIIDHFGLQTAYWVDALTFLVPALAVSLLAIPQNRQFAAGSSLGGDWWEGMALVRREGKIRIALLLVGAVALLIASLSALGVILIREKLGGSAGDFGLMMSVMGAGMLIGAVLSPRLGQRFNRLKLASTGAILAGAAILTMALAGHLGLALGAAFFLGFGFVNVQVQAQTILQETPDQMRGRILGLSQTVMGSVTFTAAALAGILAGWFGCSLVLSGAGLLVCLAGGMVVISAWRFQV